MLYKYLLLDDEITGKQLCTVLYEQGVLSTDDEDYQNFKAGNLSAMDLMLHKISSLEITPAQLALDPCSGSVVITDPSTGETLACGTGACAVAVASILNGYVKEEEVTVKLLGGDLKIYWDREENLVYMTGPAAVVFDGEIEL